jgi:(2Fe-2S) ferredoxin
MKTVIRAWPEGATGAATVTACINRRPVTAGLAMPSCGARGSEEIAAALERGIAERGLDVRFATIRCLGLCDKGPNLRVAPSNSWFHGVALADVPQILDWLAAHAGGQER